VFGEQTNKTNNGCPEMMHALLPKKKVVASCLQKESFRIALQPCFPRNKQKLSCGVVSSFNKNHGCSLVCASFSRKHWFPQDCASVFAENGVVLRFRKLFGQNRWFPPGCASFFISTKNIDFP